MTSLLSWQTSELNPDTSLRSRIPLIMMTFSAFMGFLGLFFLTQTERPLIFYIANGIMHIPLVLGWIIITFKNKLERRLHPFWTPYSLFMIFFVVTTVYFTSLQPHGVSGFLTLSETFWYASPTARSSPSIKWNPRIRSGTSCSF